MGIIMGIVILYIMLTKTWVLIIHGKIWYICKSGLDLVGAVFPEYKLSLQCHSLWWVIVFFMVHLSELFQYDFTALFLYPHSLLDYEHPRHV